MRERLRIDLERLNVEQRAAHDAIVSGARGKVEGPLRVWLLSPELAQRAQALGAFCRFETSLPTRLVELAIIVTAAHWRAEFEWHVHAPLAAASGIAAEAIEAIGDRDDPCLSEPDETIVYRFARELCETRQLGDPTFDAATALFGEAGLVELVGVLGYYALISMTINAFQVALPEGVRRRFAGSA